MEARPASRWARTRRTVAPAVMPARPRPSLASTRSRSCPLPDDLYDGRRTPAHWSASTSCRTSSTAGPAGSTARPAMRCRGSGCRFGFCTCAPGEDHLCANVPAGSSPSCGCEPYDAGCRSPSFATDIYPLLAQQSGAFGCSASSCHAGPAPAGARPSRQRGAIERCNGL